MVVKAILIYFIILNPFEKLKKSDIYPVIGNIYIKNGRVDIFSKGVKTLSVDFDEVMFLKNNEELRVKKLKGEYEKGEKISFFVPEAHYFFKIGEIDVYGVIKVFYSNLELNSVNSKIYIDEYSLSLTGDTVLKMREKFMANTKILKYYLKENELKMEGGVSATYQP